MNTYRILEFFVFSSMQRGLRLVTFSIRKQEKITECLKKSYKGLLLTSLRTNSVDERAREDKLKAGIGKYKTFDAAFDEVIKQISKSITGKDTPVDPNIVKTALFYSIMLVVVLVLAYRVNKYRSDPSLFHVPFWLVDGDERARWLLLQICYEKKFIEGLRSDFLQMKANDNLTTFAMFLADKHPTIFKGQKYSHFDALGIMGEAVRKSSQRQLYYLNRAKRGKSPSQSIDSAIDKCIKMFPELQPKEPVV